jgi:hypothetical protein
MYEHHTDPLLPWHKFAARVARHGGIAGTVLLFSLLIGTVGFHWLAKQEWIDALLDSSMLLGGMGPVGEIKTVPGKLFASAYALYAGIVFIGTAGLLVIPVVHRVLHKIRLEETRRRSTKSRVR